jgi:pantoate--beta-alanine ligase
MVPSASKLHISVISSTINDEIPMPPILTTLVELRSSIAAFRRAGETVALVPTMGALHSGHLNLVKQAKAQCKRVVVSIFVNPKQFGPHEDFDRYPRQMADDAAKLALVAPDLIWAPTPTEMYPDGFATSIEVKGAALGLETDFRPHFFGGVATVCCKLFSQVTPDIAIFGEKDYQQLAVLKQMVRDLNLPLNIVGAPTVRESDGLALSSRNAYLTPQEREIAPALHQALQDLALAVRSGAPIEDATKAATQAVLAAGFAKIDYIAVRDAQTLADMPVLSATPARILAAAWLGKTRLIDNIAVG